MKNSNSRVMADYTKMKQIAEKQCDRQEWEFSLRTIFFAAGFMYHMNQLQCDRELEKLVCKIAARCLPPISCQYSLDHVVVYYDGFGQIGRGLTYIYLKALVHLGYCVKYVAYEEKREIHNAAATLVGDGNVFFIAGNTFLTQMKSLERFLAQSQACAAFLYMNPDDVVAVGCFSRCSGIKRYLINLTDHAFWLGVSIADEIINFREFGYKICETKRGMFPDKLHLLPYYPEAPEAEYADLPFQFGYNKLIFSGGSLYKTESRDKGYYHLVEKILARYPYAAFLYLGDGDAREIRKLQRKYPGRVAYEAARKDFFEIMKRCTLYLSTYPYNGGLMTQYALLAGKVPVTLKHPGIEAELSVRQEESFWNFTTQEECLLEIGKLLEDDQYRHDKEQTLGRFLIDELQFRQELQNILETGKDMRRPGDRPAVFEGFQNIPLETIRGLKYDRLFFRRKGWYMVRYFPVKFCLGMLAATFQSVRRFLQQKNGQTCRSVKE